MSGPFNFANEDRAREARIFANDILEDIILDTGPRFDSSPKFVQGPFIRPSGFDVGPRHELTPERIHQWRKNGGDLSYYFGQSVARSYSKLLDAKIAKTFFSKYFEYCDAERVFLSVLAHPKGGDVAFALFDVFCEQIPADRMMAIMKDSIVDGVEHPALKAFLNRFLKAKPSKNAKYTQAYLGQMKKHFWSSTPDEALSALKKIQKMIREEKTPYTITSTIRINEIDHPYVLDLFDVFEKSRIDLLETKQYLVNRGDKPEQEYVDTLSDSEFVWREMPSEQIVAFTDEWSDYVWRKIRFRGYTKGPEKIIAYIFQYFEEDARKWEIDFRASIENIVLGIYREQKKLTWGDRV